MPDNADLLAGLKRLWRGEREPVNHDDQPVDDTPEQTEPGWA